MAQVYANLIRRALKTIDDVPEGKRAEVQAILDTED
ncbi:CD1375 family protein [Cohnella rhizosphaerae]|uniref:CD1375 family protein n=1 Tax=Cohnella rhizosphaerae TaxID=1457232 RepID=A0A9X4QSW6_9BACL|nr:CD1375 family protein [Cohnella rhizosphaerae]MDG0809743.1 CD1375 family protein [Cohnella rhizosphaerae]